MDLHYSQIENFLEEIIEWEALYVLNLKTIYLFIYYKKLIYEGGI